MVFVKLDVSISKILLSAGCALFLAWNTAAAQNPAQKKSSTAKLRNVSTHPASGKKKKSHRAKKASRRGQQKIDAARAREIQEALIREHYMDGSATGVWDAKSQSAMQRYQADNGWQSKSIPDSRALIKMGLGPDHQHLLNPESAMTSQPNAPHGAPGADQSRAVDTPK